MKCIIISIILLILPVTLLIASVDMLVVTGPTTQYGIPPYVIEIENHTFEDHAYIDKVEFKAANIIWTFLALGVPVFISGYLMAKSKHKTPKQYTGEIPEQLT